MTTPQEDESLARLRRLETKVHKIASHLGVEVETSSEAVPVDATTIRVTGYDVTLAMVRRAVETMGANRQVSVVDPTGRFICSLLFIH